MYIVDSKKANNKTGNAWSTGGVRATGVPCVGSRVWGPVCGVHGGPQLFSSAAAPSSSSSQSRIKNRPSGAFVSPPHIPYAYDSACRPYFFGWKPESPILSLFKILRRNIRRNYILFSNMNFLKSTAEAAASMNTTCAFMVGRGVHLRERDYTS